MTCHITTTYDVLRFREFDAPISFKAIGHKSLRTLAASAIVRANILAPRQKITHRLSLEYVSFQSDKNIAWEATGGQFRRVYNIIRLPDYPAQGDRGEALLPAKESPRPMGLPSILIARRTSDEFLMKTSFGEIPGVCRPSATST